MNRAFENFTEKARQALEKAHEEAKNHNHAFVGTEHLLLGLIDVANGVGAKALSNLAGLAQVRGAIEHIIGTGERIVPNETGLTRRAKQVIELAVQEAKALKHNYIGTEHLLLALIREGEGIAAKVLASLGVSLQDARAQVLILLSQPSWVRENTQPSGPRSNVVTFRLADRDLDAIDALIEAGIRSTRSDAAAWLVRAGIEANRSLFERVYATVAEIRQLRAEAQKIARQITGDEPAPEPPSSEAPPADDQPPPAASA